MVVPRPRFSRPVALAVLSLLSAFLDPSRAWAARWDPIPTEEMALREGRVDRESDAEALLREIRIEDGENNGSIHSDFSEHWRIKVFTKRGIDAQGRIDIPYDNKTRFLELAARMVRPNGTVVEIDRKNIFDRTLAKANKVSVKAKSFAIPNLEVGSIIEYRWTARRDDALAIFPIDLQAALAVQTTMIYVRPLSLPGLQFRIRSFNFSTPKFEPSDHDFQRAVLNSIPAERSEPYMPPDLVVHPWVLLYYDFGRAKGTEQEWREVAREASHIYEKRCRADATIKKAATEATANAKTPEEVLSALYAFSRAHVRDVSDDAQGMTAGDLEKMKPNRDAAETLKRGTGVGPDIDCLFLALASAAGFQSRMAMLSDRGKRFFTPREFTPYFLDRICVAVWTGLGWRFFDPGERYIPAGKLPWGGEGQEALLLDWSDPKFLSTPFAPASWSRASRSGSFRLDPDGTLEGDVQTQYSGHLAAIRKEEEDDRSEQEREKHLRDEVLRRVSGAELSAIRIEGASESDGPVTIRYHVRVPAYAQRVGKRLLIEPFYFQHGMDPTFEEARRTHPIYFPYAWSEEDSIAIQVPPEFAIEETPALTPLSIRQVGRHDASMAVSVDGRTLLCRRSFEFGDNGMIYFPADQYALIKKAFDGFQERDAAAIALRVRE